MDIAAAAHCGALSHCVIRHHLIIGFALQEFSLIADFLTLGDDAEELASVESRVDDLRLEGETRDLSHIDLLHLE